MVQCSNHVSYQLPNHIARIRKLIRSIESTDPKSLAAIAKFETGNDLMSDFEAMASHVLPCDSIASNKAPAKNDRHNVLDLNTSSVVGGRTCQNLDLRFYDRKEHDTLSIEDRKTLRDWRVSNPKEFGQSRKRV